MHRTCNLSLNFSNTSAHSRTALLAADKPESLAACHIKPSIEALHNSRNVRNVREHSCSAISCSQATYIIWSFWCDDHVITALCCLCIRTMSSRCESCVYRPAVTAYHSNADTSASQSCSRSLSAEAVSTSQPTTAQAGRLVNQLNSAAAPNGLKKALLGKTKADLDEHYCQNGIKGLYQRGTQHNLRLGESRQHRH